MRVTDEDGVPVRDELGVPVDDDEAVTDAVLVLVLVCVRVGVAVLECVAPSDLHVIVGAYHQDDSIPSATINSTFCKRVPSHMTHMVPLGDAD